MTDFWNKLPLIEQTNGRDIAPVNIVKLIDFCLGWKKLYDSQRQDGNEMAASTTRGRHARAMRLLVFSAEVRGLDAIKLMQWQGNTQAADDELTRLRLKVWIETRVVAVNIKTKRITVGGMEYPVASMTALEWASRLVKEPGLPQPVGEHNKAGKLMGMLPQAFQDRCEYAGKGRGNGYRFLK